MPSTELHARRLFPALTLAVFLALLRRAPGAPLGDAPTDIPAGEPSGEDGEAEGPSPELLKVLLESLLRTTERHRMEFADEFHGQFQYDVLSHYKISALPASCPRSNFSKEACLRRMLHFLEVYMAFLRAVEKECPGSTIPMESKYYSSLLIRELHKKVSDALPPPAAQVQQQLREMEASDSFQRKMKAHSILYTVHHFLVDGRSVINKRERPRGGSRLGVAFYTQKLK